MNGRTMFSKFKSSATPTVVETNPIWMYFEAGKQTGTAGPEHAWKILDGYRKNDGKVKNLKKKRTNFFQI